MSTTIPQSRSKVHVLAAKEIICAGDVWAWGKPVPMTMLGKPKGRFTATIHRHIPPPLAR